MLRAIAQYVRGQILGTNTNDNATAGNTGESVVSTVASGAAVTLTTAITANITSISLTAGDWDVSGVVDYIFAATTSYTQLTAGISLTTATLAGQPGGGGLDPDPNATFATPAAVPTALNYNQCTPRLRVSLAATTTVYLVANATFTVAGLTAFGTLRARRVR